MKWTPFTILALVTLVLQTTLGKALAIHSISPDWLLVLAVHYTLWGPWPNAAIGAWILGLLVGLAGQDRVGLHALCFGAVAWGIIRIRQALFRDHPLTQVVVTLLASLAVELAVGLYRRWSFGPAVGYSFAWHALLVAVYTAAWAPYLHWLLLRLGRWTGLRQGNLGTYRG